jgi:hypothetical protein
VEAIGRTARFPSVVAMQTVRFLGVAAMMTVVEAVEEAATWS